MIELEISKSQGKKIKYIQIDQMQMLKKELER